MYTLCGFLFEHLEVFKKKATAVFFDVLQKNEIKMEASVLDPRTCLGIRFFWASLSCFNGGYFCLSMCKASLPASVSVLLFWKFSLGSICCFLARSFKTR